VMEKLSADKFESAKKAYEEKRLFDAIEQAEEARRILSALASLYESQGQSSRVNQVSARVRNITEFIVLCRKTIAPPPPPKPEAAPEPFPPAPQSTPPIPVSPSQSPSRAVVKAPPPPPSPKDPKEFDAFHESFIAVLRGMKSDKSVKADDLLLRARLLARKETAAQLVFVQTAILVLSALGRQEWAISAEEAGILNAYAGKFPKYGAGVEAFDFLIESLNRSASPISRTRLAVVRVLALMHLDALRSLMSIDPILVKHRAVLELTDQFFSAEGEAAETIRAAQGQDSAQSFLEVLQKHDGIREPLYRTHRLLQLILAPTTFKADQAQVILAFAASEVGRPAPYPSLKPALDEWKSAFAAFKPCKWCAGSHQVNCDYRCQEGKVTKMCMVCSGTGKKPGYGNTRPCPEKYDHPHTWTEDCPRCKGTAHLDCRSCKAPWKEPEELKIVVRKACELCGNTGVLTSFRLLCPDCHGIGSILTPAKKR